MQLKFFSLQRGKKKKRHNHVFIAPLLRCDNTTDILQRGEGERNICRALQSASLVPAPGRQMVNNVQILPLIAELKRFKNARGRINA